MDTDRTVEGQQTLLPPEVIEATLRIGAIGSADHVQIQYEVHSATDGALLAMSTWPHCELARMRQRAQEALAEMLDFIEDTVIPF